MMTRSAVATPAGFIVQPHNERYSGITRSGSSHDVRHGGEVSMCRNIGTVMFVLLTATLYGMYVTPDFFVSRAASGGCWSPRTMPRMKFFAPLILGIVRCCRGGDKVETGKRPGNYRFGVLSLFVCI